MKSLLTQYGCLAEKRWREFFPRMVAALEMAGRLEEMLQEAEERTIMEMGALRRHLMKQGLTHQQAQDRAWEILRERYLQIPPED